MYASTSTAPPVFAVILFILVAILVAMSIKAGLEVAARRRAIEDHLLQTNPDLAVKMMGQDASVQRAQIRASWGIPPHPYFHERIHHRPHRW